MKSKVLLFGASTGAMRFISNKNDLDIVAIVDNDEQKHGTHLNGITIESPLKILSYSFDYVIIVTQWAKEVYKQLTNDFNIDPLKIVIPPKELLKKNQKPFAHKETKDLARIIIKQFSQSAKKHNIKLFADFGTLLGLIRDHDIIDWDDDIDFSVLEEERSNVSSWILTLIDETNLPILLQIHSNYSRSGEISSYEIEFKTKDNYYINFITSISFRRIDQNISIHLPSGGMWYAPKEHFTQSETFVWLDTDILVPCDYRKYLAFMYGDWQTPKKEISMTDYANLADISFQQLVNSEI